MLEANAGNALELDAFVIEAEGLLDLTVGEEVGALVGEKDKELDKAFVEE